MVDAAAVVVVDGIVGTIDAPPADGINSGCTIGGATTAIIEDGVARGRGTAPDVVALIGQIERGRCIVTVEGHTGVAVLEGIAVKFIERAGAAWRSDGQPRAYAGDQCIIDNKRHGTVGGAGGGPVPVIDAV